MEATRSQRRQYRRLRVVVVVVVVVVPPPPPLNPSSVLSTFWTSVAVGEEERRESDVVPLDPNLDCDGPLPYGSYRSLLGVGGGEEEEREGEFGPSKSTCLVTVSLDVGGGVGVGGTGDGDAVLDTNSNRPGGSIGVGDGGGGDAIASAAVRNVQNLVDSGFNTFQISDEDEDCYDVNVDLDSYRNDSGSSGGRVDGGGGGGDRMMKREDCRGFQLRIQRRRRRRDRRDRNCHKRHWTEENVYGGLRRETPPSVIKDFCHLTTRLDEYEVLPLDSAAAAAKSDPSDSNPCDFDQGGAGGGHRDVRSAVRDAVCSSLRRIGGDCIDAVQVPCEFSLVFVPLFVCLFVPFSLTHADIPLPPTRPPSLPLSLTTDPLPSNSSPPPPWK